MMDVKDNKCSKCSGDTILGDTRSGIITFGAHFVELIKSNGGVFKPKPGISKYRVVSYACIKCGYIEQYLEDRIKTS